CRETRGDLLSILPRRRRRRPRAQPGRRHASERRRRRRDRRAHAAEGRGAHRESARDAKVDIMPRLFTGLEIPDAIGQQLSMLRGGLPGARWIDPENYHVTLRFIGDIDDALAHEAASALGRIRRPAFDLRFQGLTSFGGRKPRAVIAEATTPQVLMELQAEQERLMRRIGLEPEGRKYIPHVT